MNFETKLKKEQKRKEEIRRSNKEWDEHLRKKREAEELFVGHNTALHKAERNPNLDAWGIEFLQSIRRCLCKGWKLSEKREKELNRLANY